MSYNVKIITYQESGEQDIRFYLKPIRSGDAYAHLTMKPVNDNDLRIIDDDDICGIDPDSIVQLNFGSVKDKAIADMLKAERSVRSSMNRTKNTVYDYARANAWEWFVTLTFAPDKVDRYDYDACVQKLSNWLDNTKKRKCRDMRYVAVPEKHKDGAYHFHLLMSDIDELDMVDSGKKDKGNVIYNIGNYRFGWTTATRVRDTSKASNYITKYITKDLCSMTKGKKRYWNSRNLNKGEVQELVLDGQALVDMKRFAKKKATYENVVNVDVQSYCNTIEYFTIKI